MNVLDTLIDDYTAKTRKSITDLNKELFSKQEKKGSANSGSLLNLPDLTDREEIKIAT